MINFFIRLIEKFGLAASWIKTFIGLNFLINLNAINEESDLSLPPLIIKTFLGYFFFICFLSLTTKIIFLKNFELIADVKTEDNSNSGIYFHTNFQESGWPEKGYECQVFNGAKNLDTTNYIEKRMTGSLYAVRDVTKSPVQNNEWFQYRIVV